MKCLESHLLDEKFKGNRLVDIISLHVKNSPQENFFVQGRDGERNLKFLQAFILMRVGPSQNALGIPPEGLMLKQTSDLSQKMTMKDIPTSLPRKCWVEKN